MGRNIILAHEFVEFIPEQLKERTLYISEKYRTAVHKCCCGCGREVVTPLSPVAWQVKFDGKSVSLWPSVGNWSLPCQSHYVIRESRVLWAGQMSKEEIERGRQDEALAKQAYYAGTSKAKVTEPPPMKRIGFWKRFLNWLFGWLRILFKS